MVKQQIVEPQRRFASYAYGLESYLKNSEKCRAQNCKSYMKIWKIVVLTAQHEAAKVNKKDLRRVAKMKLAWLYPTKVRKQLQLIGLASDQT